jgi:hypothetical protein
MARLMLGMALMPGASEGGITPPADPKELVELLRQVEEEMDQYWRTRRP